MNYDKLKKNLTTMFCYQEYAKKPWSNTGDEHFNELAMKYYDTDLNFKVKIDSYVNNILNIVEACDKNE